MLTEVDVQKQKECPGVTVPKSEFTIELQILGFVGAHAEAQAGGSLTGGKGELGMVCDKVKRKSE